MGKKIQIASSIIFGIVGITAAVYLAVMLISNQTVGTSLRQNYEIVLPTQWPTRPSDMEGLVVAVKDNSVMVTPVFKRKDAQQEYPQVEVVVTNTTEIYLDETDRQHPNVVDGKFYWVLNPFALDRIQAGYVVNVWGNRRGDRWIADTIIVYVIPSEENPKP
jgi:hypothetical protein